ncbi:MAG: CHASE2 domain-containing protein, partial [Candidatus Eremiobacterota bacterium]
MRIRSLTVWLQSGIAGLILGLLLASPASRSLMEGLERRGLDLLFQGRYLLHGTAPLEPRLTLIGVDEATFSLTGKPQVFWNEDYAEVLNALVDAGARVVGVDFIVNPELGAFDPAHPVRAYLNRGEEALARTVLSGRVVLIEYLRPSGALQWGDKIHLAAVARQGVGPGNLDTDPDGVVRRARLFFPDLTGKDPIWSFPALLAIRAADGSLTVQNGAAWLGSRPVPVLGDPRSPAMLVNYPGPPGCFP